MIAESAANLWQLVGLIAGGVAGFFIGKWYAGKGKAVIEMLKKQAEVKATLLEAEIDNLKKKLEDLQK